MPSLPLPLQSCLSLCEWQPRIYAVVLKVLCRILCQNPEKRDEYNPSPPPAGLALPQQPAHGQLPLPTLLAGESSALTAYGALLLCSPRLFLPFPTPSVNPHPSLQRTLRRIVSSATVLSLKTSSLSSFLPDLTPKVVCFASQAKLELS